MNELRFSGSTALVQLLMKRAYQLVGLMLYVLGLFAFLCGATVPLASVYFFLNVDIVIQWWHVLLGIGGNIAVFIVSMNMLRDLYVRPLIDRIEHNRSEGWERG